MELQSDDPVLVDTTRSPASAGEEVTAEDIAVYAEGPTNPHYLSVKEKVERAISGDDEIREAVEQTREFIAELPEFPEATRVKEE